MSTRFWKLAALVLSFAILPAAARAQAMQSVCKDGTKSANAGTGTCSGHNGVDAAATKTFLASGKTVMCTDGAMSAGGRGACSGHGGIGKKGAENAAVKVEKKADAKADMKADTKADMKADMKAGMKTDMKPVKKGTKPAKKDVKAPA